MSDVKLNVLTLGQRGNKKYQGQHRMFYFGNFDLSLKLHHIHAAILQVLFKSSTMFLDNFQCRIYGPGIEVTLADYID